MWTSALSPRPMRVIDPGCSGSATSSLPDWTAR